MSKNSENMQLLEHIGDNLNWVLMSDYDLMKTTPNWANEVNRLRKLALTSLPQEVKDWIDKSDLTHYTRAEVTVQITTKKKGRVMIADFYHKELVGKFIEIDEKYLDRVYYKQIIAGIVENDKLVHILNAKPKKFCCDGMRGQFRICEQDGILCDKYFIEYHLNGQYYIQAKNGTYGISHCPFCGSEIANHAGRMLIIE
jgi:hypothetical protein